MRLVLWSVIPSAVLQTGCCTTQRVAEYPLPILPPAPSIVTWHRSAFLIYLTVLQVPRATSYVIEGYTAENGTWNIQVPVTPSPLLPGQTFDTSIVSPLETLLLYVRVRAVNGAGQGPASPAITPFSFAKKRGKPNKISLKNQIYCGSSQKSNHVQSRHIRKCKSLSLQLSHARFLSSEGRIYHGAHLVSVALSIMSRARE